MKKRMRKAVAIAATAAMVFILHPKNISFTNLLQNECSYNTGS